MVTLLNIIGAMSFVISLAMLIVGIIQRRDSASLITASSLALIFALVAASMFFMGGSIGNR